VPYYSFCRLISFAFSIDKPLPQNGRNKKSASAEEISPLTLAFSIVSKRLHQNVILRAVLF